MHRHHLTTTTAAFFLLCLSLLSPYHPSQHLAEAGCYQPHHPDPSRHRLCCVGRNHTCKAVDERRRGAPTSHQPYQDEQRQRVIRSSSDDSLVISLVPMRGDQFPPVLEARTRRRLGRLVLPDMVELDERGVEVARRAGELHSFPMHECQ